MAEEANAATPETGTAPEAAPEVRPVPRDVRHSVDYAADRIAGLIGAVEPTETPSDDPTPPSPEAADEGSTDDVQDVNTPETSEGEPEADTEEATPELPSTLEELVAAFEASPEWADGLKVTIKVDGEEQEVTLAEARNGYQRAQDYIRKTTELAEQRKSLDDAVTQAETELRSRAERLSTLTSTLEQQLTGAEPDWNRLLAEDPQGYLRAQHEWKQKTEALKGAQAERDRLMQHQQAQTARQMQEHLQAEHKKMVTNWPELADPKGPAATELRGYLAERGFSAKDIEGIADHRMIGVLQDAMKAWKTSTATPEKKLQKPKPARTIKPGTPSGEDEKADRLAAARRNHKRNPKDISAAAARIALAIKG